MIHKNKIQLLSILITVFILNSCTSVPRSELQNLPSLIEIKSINFEDGLMQVRISHRNNSTKKNNLLSCQLAFKNFAPIAFNQIPLPDLTNYAVEIIDIKLSSIDLPAVDQVGKEMSYVLDCFVFSENYREEHIIKKSILFLVPGSEAEYR